MKLPWSFYAHYGFIPLPWTPRRLFLPMGTIAGAVSFERRPSLLLVGLGLSEHGTAP